MTEKTEALVLRTSPYSRTSQIVTWLTPDFGRLVTMIKGACRPKSQFLGQYDLYYTCELVFYKRDRNGVHIAKECAPLETRSAFRSDWRAAAGASYLCDLLCLVGLPGHPQRDLYDLTRSSLDFLSSPNGEKQQLLYWFEIHLAHLLGISPQLSMCVSCGSGIAAPPRAFFSAKQGGVLCEPCAQRREEDSSPVRHDVLAILRAWQTAASARSARSTHCSVAQQTALMDLLGAFLKYHLDRVPESRYRAFKTLMFKGY